MLVSTLVAVAIHSLPAKVALPPLIIGKTMGVRGGLSSSLAFLNLFLDLGALRLNPFVFVIPLLRVWRLSYLVDASNGFWPGPCAVSVVSSCRDFFSV